MPEIKHNFTGGKMNKDVDQRLVPKGEYRDAMNIQVSTSEGSDVGTVQNILGNSAVTTDLGIDSNSMCVGAIADEKNDALYWFVREPIAIAQPRDIIFELKNGYIKKVFVDYKVESGGVLKFPEHTITGINIIDDMLFWTDGHYDSNGELIGSEPKKINIPRSIEGTFPNGNFHTRLINPDQNIGFSSGILIQEEHITVVRKAPKNKLLMNLFTGRDVNLNYSGILQVSSELNLSDSSLWAQRGPTYNASWPYDFSTFSTEEGNNIIKLRIDSDLDGNTTFDLDAWSIGSKVVLKPFDFNGTTVPSIPITDHVIKGTIVPWYWTNSLGVVVESNSFTSTTPWGCKVMIKIDSIDGTPPPADASGIMKYAIDLFDETEKLFEFKFPRFSYRYKYKDGEYSTFAPWTSVAFLPGSFDYHPKKGYNLGMGNNLQKLTLRNFITPDMPKDVVEVDILYKDDQSPNVHVVETFSKSLENQNNWDSNEFTIEEENIRAVLPSNQFLRPWDNVPRNAVAQEITGNRIVYGNYLQNYTLKEVSLNPIFSHYLSSGDNNIKSIKSLREYQLGVVFTDEHGRETPVITNNTGVFKVEKDKAIQKNKLTASISSQSIPLEMKYFKFYIKETSGEYYNMVMSRWYDAKDNNVWLSFPSSDRNKIDIDTFLILKKGIAQTTGGVNENARYKILAIENEAPDFIKSTEYNIAEIVHNNTGAGIGGDVYGNNTTNAPIVNSTYFHADFGEFDNSSAAELDKITDDLYVDFSMVDDNRVSAKYKIVEVVKNMDAGSPLQPENFVFKIDGRFGNDVNFITNDPLSGVNATEILDFTTTRFYKRVVENKPEFDGRFFVKIYFDDVIQKYIKSPLTSSEDIEYSEFMSQKIYSMSGSHKQRHDDTSFGVNSAVYSGSDPDSDTTQCAIDFGGNYAHNWYYYSAYFANYRGSDHSVLGDKVPMGDIDVLNPINNAANCNNCTTYEDVWFVDYGDYKGSYSGDWDGTVSYFNPSTTDGSSNGIVNNSNNGSMSLSFGGINKNTSWGQGPFYDLDRSPYDEYIPFIDTLSAGYKFRWKEDPTRTVYTIYAATTTKNIINYDDDQNNCSFQRLENFRKKHKFSFEPAMVWDPTEQDNVVVISNGIIINGDENGTDLTAMNTVANVSYLDISTAQYNATYDSGGGSRTETIVPGLILYKINGSTTFNVDNNPVLIHSVEDTTGGKRLNFIGYKGTRVDFSISSTGHQLEFRQPAMNGLSVNSARNINHFNASLGTLGSLTPGIGAVGYTLQFLNEEISDQLIPDDPAVWETEPKDSTDIDIYHEIGDTIPLDLNGFSGHVLAPVGSLVSVELGVNATVPAMGPNTTVVGWDGNVVELSAAANNCDMTQGDFITFLRSDGSSIKMRLNGLAPPITPGPCDTSFFLAVDPDIRNYPIEVGFDWHNCYSFGNGVESNRIRDNFNQPFISNGAKVSAVLDEPYKEEYRKHGLIYSGIYNSTSGVNNLNQFIAAEKITKDINPIYGSIQKLYSGWGQGGDLIALCEDRVLKILANKDALYNADGNTNVTSTNNVLGQAIPYSGEYGISKNPESFASEAYRIYFTDKVRGTVMRLSMDGLTPISNHGMKDWFRDHLKLGDKLIGSYDDKKDEYNITIKGDTIAKTVTFKEDVKGWVSFKSFTPENAISCANEYYTFKDGNIWKHHDEFVNRNTFYDQDLVPSTLEVVFNEVPGSVKSFKTVNYEGSQAKVTSKDENDVTLMDGEYFNLADVEGWHVTNVITNLEQGGITEFINKEGKWFGYVIGNDVVISEVGNASGNYDTEDSSIQGIGRTAGTTTSVIFGCMDDGGPTNLDVQGDGSNIVGTFANPADPGVAAFNYNNAATNDDGSCVGVVEGCTDATADNWYITANTDDGTCYWLGCTTGPLALAAQELSGGSLNFDANATVDDGSCIPAVWGCTAQGNWNYNPSADFGSGISSDGSFCGGLNCMCIPFIGGCTDAAADNYITPVNEEVDVNYDDGSCEYLGCTDPIATNYSFTGSTVDGPNGNLTYLNGIAVDDGSCTYIGGCMDALACNFDATATVDNGLCNYCGDTSVSTINNDGADPSCTTGCEYCYGPTNLQIISQTTADAGMSNGEVVIEWTESTSPSINYYQLSYLGNVIDILDSGTGTGTYTITGLSAGTFTIDLNGICDTTAGGTALGLGLSTTITITSTPIPGCTDGTGANNNVGGTWGACNYDASATVDDGTCEYATCTGCNDNMFLEFCGDCWDAVNQVVVASGGSAWVADTIPTSCTTIIVSGCTDATAFNYDPTATVDDGSCVPFIYGCTVNYLNIAGSSQTYASANYDSSANTDCDAAGTGPGNNECCDDWNCPSGTIALNGTDLELDLNGANTPYIVFVPAGNSPTMSLEIVDNNSNSIFSNTNMVYQPGTSTHIWGSTVPYQTSNLGTIATSDLWTATDIQNVTSLTVNWTISTGNGLCSTLYTQSYTVGCTDAAADNTGTWDVGDDSQCTYTGCMDATLNADGFGLYAADNYNSSATTLCNGDNSCCTYTGTPLVSELQGFGFGGSTAYQRIRTTGENTGTAYDQAIVTSLDLGVGTNTNTITNPGIEIIPPVSWSNGEQAFSGLVQQNEWVPYVDINGAYGVASGDLTITYHADWSGTIDNPSMSDEITTNTSNTFVLSAGCKTDSSAMNYNSNLDLHIDGSCMAPNPGCMDSTATNYDAAFNQDCTQTSSADGNTQVNDCCCYTCDVPSWDATNPVVVNTWAGVAPNLYASQVTFNFAVVSTAVDYDIIIKKPDGSYVFLSNIIPTSISGTVASYVYNNGSPSLFLDESTYEFLVEAHCENGDGDSCGTANSGWLTITLNN